MHLENQQRQLEKTAVVKAGPYIVSIGRKTTVYRLEATLKVGDITPMHKECVPGLSSGGRGLGMRLP